MSPAWWRRRRSPDGCPDVPPWPHEGLRRRLTSFHPLTATACPSTFANLNTDRSYRLAFSAAARGPALGKRWLHDLRFDADGARGRTSAHPAAWRGADHVAGAISARLLARRRGLCALRLRHPWVIAPSFRDIFQGTRVKQAPHRARLGRALAEIMSPLAPAPELGVSVYLDSRRPVRESAATASPSRPFSRHRLLRGLCDIALTQLSRTRIASFSRRCDQRSDPWAAPIAWPAVRDRSPDRQGEASSSAKPIISIPRLARGLRLMTNHVHLLSPLVSCTPTMEIKADPNR